MSPRLILKHKKYVLIFLSTILIGVLIAVCTSLYLKEYQKVLNEYARLQDNHCIAVNPLLIDTKTAYIGSMKSIVASDSASYISAQYSWLGSAKEFLKLEKLWLQNERSFLSEEKTKLFLSSTRREAAEWEYRMYEQEYRGIEGIVKRFETNDVNLREVHQKMLDIESERSISQQSYNLKWGSEKLKSGFIDQFVTQPVSQCPPKSQTIPQIEEGMNARPVPNTSEPETLMPVIR